MITPATMAASPAALQHLGNTQPLADLGLARG